MLHNLLQVSWGTECEMSLALIHDTSNTRTAAHSQIKVPLGRGTLRFTDFFCVKFLFEKAFSASDTLSEWLFICLWRVLIFHSFQKSGAFISGGMCGGEQFHISWRDTYCSWIYCSCGDRLLHNYDSSGKKTLVLYLFFFP